MHLIDRILEERLQRTEASGELRGVGGSGRPLRLQVVSSVPDELRATDLLPTVSSPLRRSALRPQLGART